MKTKAALNGQRSTPTNKINIRCIIFLYFGSVERRAWSDGSNLQRALSRENSYLRDFFLYRCQ